MVSQHPQSSSRVILKRSPAMILLPVQRESRTDRPESSKNEEPRCQGHREYVSSGSVPITLSYSPGSGPSERRQYRLPPSKTIPARHAPAFDSEALIASRERHARSGSPSAGIKGPSGALGTTPQNHTKVLPAAKRVSESTRGTLARPGFLYNMSGRTVSVQHCKANQIEGSKRPACMVHVADPMVSVNQSTAVKGPGMSISDAQIRPDLQLEDPRISAEDVVKDRLILIPLHIQCTSKRGGMVLRPSATTR